MRIGIDIDGTIDKAPAFYAVLTRALLLSGNEVHIITYRSLNLTEYTYAQLRKWKIQYTRLHISTREMDSPQWKAKVAQEMELDMMIDDDINNLNALPEKIQKLHVMSQIDTHWQKLEDYLNLPIGSINRVLLDKQKIIAVIETLQQHHVQLDEHLRIVTKEAWRTLKEKAGMTPKPIGIDDNREMQIEVVGTQGYLSNSDKP